MIDTHHAVGLMEICVLSEAGLTVTIVLTFFNLKHL